MRSCAPARPCPNSGQAQRAQSSRLSVGRVRVLPATAGQWLLTVSCLDLNYLSDDKQGPNMDMEARAHSEHPEALRLWLRLLTCTQIVEKQVRSQLRERFDTTLPRFDLMAQLERAPDGLKMNELSRSEERR